MVEGAFEGVRVVELAQWVFVPVAGALLADWGADVVRIEKLEGDPYRGLATQDVIDTWIDYKYNNEILPMAQRPHPYEFELYYGV